MKQYKLPKISKTNITLPVFPIPIFLLPGGVTKLRIFEPKYLKLVSIALPNQGFVICLSQTRTTESSPKVDQDRSMKAKQWGSWVDIVNFDQGDDGILEIDVKCKSLVELGELTKGVDNLYFANVSNIQHWSQYCDNKGEVELARALENVFDDNEILSNLYPQKSLTDTNWVLARWLEILPIDLTVKSAFVDYYNVSQATKFVESVILNELSG